MVLSEHDIKHFLDLSGYFLSALNWHLQLTYGEKIYGTVKNSISNGIIWLIQPQHGYLPLNLQRDQSIKKIQTFPCYLELIRTYNVVLLICLSFRWQIVKFRYLIYFENSSGSIIKLLIWYKFKSNLTNYTSKFMFTNTCLDL